MGNLDGRVALVTGGSRGIGRAIAVELARHGARVSVNYNASQAAAAAVVAEITASGGDAAAIAGDVSVPDEAAALVKGTVERFGGLDILVNNAGITKDGLLFRMSEDDWESVISTNLTSCYHWTKLIGRPMTQKRWGRIVNITSVVGLMGNAGQANYCAAKAGMIGFTKAIAKEFAARNVTCNAVAPGFIKTDMTAALPEEAGEKLQSVIPLKRLGEAADIAHMVAFLASEEAGYITGQVFTVDGGMVM